MPLTVTNVWTQPQQYAGDMQVAVADVQFDTSYLTGGEVLPANQVTGPQVVSDRILFIVTASHSGYLFEFDYVNQKLKARTPVNAVPAVAAHSHTENTAAAYTQNATTGTAGAITASIAAPGAEVANGTNLGSVTVRVLAYLI